MAQANALSDRAGEKHTIAAPISFQKNTGSDVDRVLEAMQRQLQSLKQEHDSVQRRIVEVRRTITGLVQIFGWKVVSEELRGLLIPGTRRSGGSEPGLTKTCFQLLAESSQSLTVGELLELMQQKHPTILAHHKNPKASLTVVLTRLSKSGHVQSVLNARGGRVWRSTIELVDAKRNDDRDSQQSPFAEEAEPKR